MRATLFDPLYGNIYACDSDAGAVHCFTDSGEVIASSPAGAVSRPVGFSLCLHSRRIAVADGKLVRILRADNLSPVKTLSCISDGHQKDVEFTDCTDAAFDFNGFLYVVDSGGSRVVVFDPNYVSIACFGSSGSGDGQFDEATGICVDGTGKVFVSDKSRIQLFDRGGRHILSLLPAQVHEKLEWGQLKGICVDGAGRLLVCSQATRCLLHIL